jgi:hypothetical protein
MAQALLWEIEEKGVPNLDSNFLIKKKGARTAECMIPCRRLGREEPIRYEFMTIFNKKRGTRVGQNLD